MSRTYALEKSQERVPVGHCAKKAERDFKRKFRRLQSHRLAIVYDVVTTGLAKPGNGCLQRVPLKRVVLVLLVTRRTYRRIVQQRTRAREHREMPLVGDVDAQRDYVRL